MWYCPQVHWTVDDNDHDFPHEALDQLKDKIEATLNDFISTEMNRTPKEKIPNEDESEREPNRKNSETPTEKS